MNTPAPEMQTRPRDILIVDDNPENLKVLGDFLGDQGFNVRVARDGRQALVNVAASIPEVILLDIHMPVMDGYETCLRLKAMPELQDTPILFLSALGETFNKVRAFEVGGVDYITKPFDLEEVRVRLQNHLQTMRLLAESRAGFRASFEQAAVGMALLSYDGCIFHVNHRLCSMTGFSAEELDGLSLIQLAHPDSRQDLAAALEAAGGNRIEQPARELQCRDKSGALLWCRMTFSYVQVAGTNREYISVIVEDVTEHKRSIDEGRRLAAALEQVAEAIAITDDAGAMIYSNNAYQNAYGGAGGSKAGEILPLLEGESSRPIWEEISRGEVWRGRRLKPGSDGRMRTEEYLLTPLSDERDRISNYVAVVRDLTSQVRLEEQLRQSQKMEAIGTLAAGIAHDFNNLLAAITGFTDLTLEELEASHPCRGHLEEVMSAAGHATELVRQILTFARQSPLEVRPVHLHRIADDALKLLRRTIPPHIEIQRNFDENCPPVLADATAIHQIIMNLCTNAYHAMDAQGGLLSVRISEIEIEQESLQGHPNLSPGSYVRLDVTDTGHGMDKQTVQRIFDPYFTTKERGSGTGLGLATVHGIVSDLRGAVSVYSELGSGSTFSILLPATEEETAGPKRTGTSTASGSERILFVDDEKALCLFAATALNRIGYRTTAVSSPCEALALFEASPEDFDLVVTDELMPEMRGTELLPRLRRIRPDIPVILYSGFAETFRSRPPGEEVFNAYVMKPMVVSELTKVIRSVAGGEGAPDAARSQVNR